MARTRRVHHVMASLIVEEGAAAEKKQPRVPAVITLRRRSDRRNLASREALTQRIAAEFREIPGLCLTVPQACRLFGLPTDVCERILKALTQDGIVQCSGTYYGMWRGDFIATGFLTQESHRHHR